MSRGGAADREPDIRARATRLVFTNPWLTLREDEVQFPDGHTGRYAVVDKADFVTVVPYADGGFWLVQQFRYAVGSREWEFPQGGWPPGRTGSPAQLARAELAEETGLRAGSWTKLGRLFAAPGYSSQSFEVFLATDLTAGAPRREPTEQDMVHRWVGDAQLRAMIGAGSFADSHSVAALALFDLHRAAAR